ncbi:DUF4397 domain-containing protein [Pseudochryseolinea flava]|uniref:DUF4397 domain-containing protein n=1 Tax=Pseudochryseolinea flava TaxID=2059302 RepID=A0A364Y0M2_9BACT|nr:DUF4397 domain-containing protein [Pseudochryseolinea flava]RAW00131.1 hypothetical protein DQQ10_16415 [Pseudochryseolinea flava]
MRKIQRTLVYGLCVIGFAGGLAACSDFVDDNDNTPYPSPAQVSFYNASPSAPQVTVTVDEKSFLNAPLDYTHFSGYLNFYTGNRHFKFKNGSNTLVDTTLLLKNNTTYSVFVINHNENIETVVTTDTANVPNAGKAMVRFMQLSPDVDQIDVAFEGDAENTFAALDYKEGSVFKEVTARKLKVVMKNADTDDEVLTSGEITLQPGRYYTIISRGYKTPPQGNTNTLSVQVVAND